MSPYVNQNSCDNCNHKISVMVAYQIFRAMCGMRESNLGFALLQM